MKTIIFITSWALIMVALTSKSFAQGVAISGDPNATPHGSAMLDVQSTEKGMLVPRLTQAQRNSITNPAQGLLIYQTNNTPGFYYNSGTPASPNWQMVGSNTGTSSQWGNNAGNIYYNSGKVGIGTNTPNAQLHVEGMGSGEGNILFSGEVKSVLAAGDPPAEGPGTRMMWYPDRAAFRAGHVTGMAWNKDSIGNYSTAWGLNSRAMGTYSTAWGIGSRANGTNSTAWGQNSTAGSNATAWGLNTIATGSRATAWGENSIAGSSNATAWGRNTIASGMRSTAWGDSTVASGFYSTAWGNNTNSSSYGTTAWGDRAEATTYYATAWGSNTIASGRYATSWGTDTEAEGWYSTTWGNNTLASARYSTAWGNSTTALSGYETVIGAFNTLYEPASTLGWNSNDRLFVIANGTHNLTRNDALVVMKNGNVGIGSSSPSSKLEVNGQIRITGGSPGAGRVLTSDNTGLATWNNPSSFSSGTLDQAYNFGGSGSGRNIEADAGALKITGTDGFLVTGTVNEGAVVEATGGGTRMFFNPRRAAFRAGHVTNASWNADSLGLYSIAMGHNSRATGDYSVALGQAIIASGRNSTAIGLVTTASGQTSTAIGSRTNALSGFEIAMGRWNTLYTPNSTLGWNENDRLFVIGNGTNDDNRSDAFVILKSAKAGFGTSTPDARLVIGSNENEDALRVMVNNDTKMFLRSNGGLAIGEVFTQTPENGLSVAGDVGIGTGQPLAKLHVERNSSASNPQLRLHSATSNGFARVRMSTEGHSDVWDIRAGGISNNLDFMFATNQSIMTLRGETKRVGVGLNNPSDQLHVSADAGQHAFRVQVDGVTRLRVYSNGGVSVGANYTEGTVPEGGMRVFTQLFTGGSVGVGTSNPGVFRLAVNGDAAKPGGGSWSSFSDARLKNSVEPMIPGILDRLLQLNGYTFEYEPEAIENRLALPGRQTGLIAQEVQQVFPDWVDADDEGYLYVTERGLTAIIVEALRELRAEKDTEIESLKSRLTALEALMDLPAGNTRVSIN